MTLKLCQLCAVDFTVAAPPRPLSDEGGQRHIYVTPVVDAEGKAIGMLRMHDVVGG